MVQDMAPGGGDEMLEMPAVPPLAAAAYCFRELSAAPAASNILQRLAIR